MRHAPRLVALAAIGMLAAVSACGAGRDVGVPTATSGSVPAGGSASAGATSVTAEPTTGVPAPQPGPVGGSGSPVPTVPGVVSVTLDTGSYPVGALIHVTVSNGTNRPIYTEDFKTECTIVILQRHRDGGAWSDILGCVLGRPTATVTIGPGRGQAIELNPTSVHLSQGEPGGPAFGKGTYRVKFTYRTDAATPGDDPLAAYSPEFTVR